MKSFFKAFFITLLVVTIIFIGSTGYFLVKSHIQNPVAFFEELQKPQDSIEFLLLGVDSLKSKEANNTRSDTIMIVRVDMKSNNINIISVPRDTRTAIEGRRNKEKINHAYNYGGSQLSLKTLNRLLGLDIQYYVTIDYNFVKDIVDVVGGVPVNVPIDMEYEDPSATPPLYINLKKGDQVLSGNKALQFLRFRKGYADQDLGRVQAQQLFVKSFLGQLKKPANIVKLPLLLNAYERNTQSNLPLSSIVKMGWKMKDAGAENINSQTLPGAPKRINGLDYVIMNEKETGKVLTNMGFK